MSNPAKPYGSDQYCDFPAMTFREIARRLGVTHQTAVKDYHNGMRKLLKGAKVRQAATCQKTGTVI